MTAITKVNFGNEDNIIQIFGNQEEKPKREARNKKGGTSRVDPFSLDQINVMANYMLDHHKYLHYMTFVLSCNFGRRFGDMRRLTWANIFNADGSFRAKVDGLTEEKTGKHSAPIINEVCRETIKMYIEKMRLDVSKNNYQNPVFLQLDGTGVGNVISHDGWHKALKRYAEICGIEQNVGTHSCRKTFGAVSVAIHPGDPMAKSIVQETFNHSSEATTMRYIGITDKRKEQYFNDFGEAFQKYGLNGEEYESKNEDKFVHLELAVLREVIKAAYVSGINNAGTTDPEEHIKAMNEILAMVDENKC